VCQQIIDGFLDYGAQTAVESSHPVHPPETRFILDEAREMEEIVTHLRRGDDASLVGHNEDEDEDEDEGTFIRNDNFWILQVPVCLIHVPSIFLLKKHFILGRERKGIRRAPVIADLQEVDYSCHSHRFITRTCGRLL
jgi:hypothetical protein